MEEPDWIRESRKNLQETEALSHTGPAKRKFPSKPGQKKATVDVDDQSSRLLASIQEKSRDKESQRPRPLRKIYFCSRTHSQLSQVMESLGKIAGKNPNFFSDWSAISLGSRKNLCLNKQVSKLPSLQRINDQCIEMQKSPESCCPFYNDLKEANMELLVDNLHRLHVADIEDIKGLGERIGACSYYGSRRAQEGAHFITIPYNILLQKASRESFGIDLANSLVIIDEGHNIIDTINQIYSVSLPLTSLKLAQEGLVGYLDRYSRRLSGQHAQLLQQLLHAISQLVSYLATAADGIHRINEFVHEIKIDNLNAFPIEAYAQESHLSQKVSSFYANNTAAVEQSGSATNLLNDIIQFLILLSNADKNGRILISEQTYKFISLNPEQYFMEVVEEAHSVILAGGTMSPTADFIEQLFGDRANRVIQFQCGHLIPKENCRVFTLSSGPSNVPFDFTLKMRESAQMIQELGQTAINMTNVVPDGIACFFPSYAYLDHVIESWSNNGTLDTIRKKKPVFIENSSLKSVESLIEGYTKKINDPNGSGALIFGVMGGRLSEGINFSDKLARLVMIVGLPFPNINDPETRERMAHYVNSKKNHQPDYGSSTPQSEYLEGLCMRTVNQTIGRAIRHKDDYASILLIDQRYRQDRIKSKLSSWIQESTVDTPSFGFAYSNLVKFYKSRK